MRTITGYLVSGVLQRTSATLSVLLCIYAVFDLIELQTMQHHLSGSLLLSYIYKIPTIINQMLPLAGAVGVSLTVSKSMEHGEWQALSALGLHRSRVCIALMVIPAMMVLVSVAMVYHIAPYTLAAANSVGTTTKTSKRRRWIQSGPWLLHINQNNDVNRAVRLSAPVTRFEEHDNQWRKWTEGSGWTTESSGPHPPENSVWTEPPRLGAFQGSALTYPELSAKIDDQTRMGLRTNALKAEKGLRWVLPMATFLVPFATLLFNLRFGKTNASRTGHAIFGAALYWLFTAFLWNGIQMGIWTGPWLICGAPILYVTVVTLLIGIFPPTRKRLFDG